jgi:hypothetical protein
MRVTGHAIDIVTTLRPNVSRLRAPSYDSFESAIRSLWTAYEMTRPCRRVLMAMFRARQRVYSSSAVDPFTASGPTVIGIHH